jgi:hypothetical protein
MIHLEITKSPDKNVLTDFKFHQNEVYLGNSSGTLHIKDSALRESHVMIEVVERDLIVHPQKGVDAYLIDGKRSSSIRKITIGQVITIGTTTFKVIAFEETLVSSKKKILDEKLNKLLEESSQRLVVIEKLAKLMK